MSPKRCYTVEEARTLDTSLLPTDSINNPNTMNAVFHVGPRLARHDALVLHPGPMIRGLEIDSAVADGPQSGVLDQVTNGLAVRMALLYHLIGGAPVDAPHPAKERSNAAD